MGLPRKLKDMALFYGAVGYTGQVASVTLPKLTRKMESWRGAGMDSPVKIDMGGDDLDMEWTGGGPLKEVLGDFASRQLDSVLMRFAGAYQADDTGETVAIEVYVRGRHEEIEMGEQKTGEGGEFKVKTALSYYRLEWNGEVLIEIDPLNRVLTVNGVDLLADTRAALGI